MKLLLRAVKLLAISGVLLVLAAFVYEHVSAWRDDRIAKRVGRPVDIGGRTLNIHCSGQGEPTVIFESARLAPGYVWTHVQRRVSAFTRACWYDRANLGWSDTGPDPSWGDAAARDLHDLTTHAGLEPPFVLVGHSFGGYIARLYNAAYPGEVAGMVLVDAAHEDAARIRGIPHRDRPPIPRPVIRALSIGLGHLGMMRLLARHPGPPPPQWTAAEWDVLFRLRRRRNVLLADAQVGPETATADLVRAAGGLENMPLIVLTQGSLSHDSASGEARVQREWIELQADLARRSARGRQVVVENSGHGIPLEAPAAVVSAVRDIIEEIRKRP